MDCGRSEQGDAQCHHLSRHAVSRTSLADLARHGPELALAAVAALFFLRFWRRTKDRFFALFGAAFAALAVNWLGLAVTDQHDESRTYFFWVRLASLVRILLAIWDKNRARQAVK